MTRDLVLFCGMGGATEGLVRAGWNVTHAVDYWEPALDAHLKWHPQIRTVRARVEEAHTLVDGPFRCVWASPSCKPYSTANRTPKRGTKHPEYYPLARLIGQAFDTWEARWLVIENVGGLLWSKEGKEELVRLDAEVHRRRDLYWQPSLVYSNDHGVYQIRRRVFIVVGPWPIAIPASCTTIPGPTRRAILGDDHANKWRPEYVSGRAVRGIVDASQPSRHANWTHAQPSAMECEGTKGSWGIGYAQPTVRTLAECCELQQVPLLLVEHLSKRVAHELVGNAVPPSLAEWVGRVVLARGRIASGTREDACSST